MDEEAKAPFRLESRLNLGRPQVQRTLETRALCAVFLDIRVDLVPLSLGLVCSSMHWFSEIKDVQMILTYQRRRQTGLSRDGAQVWSSISDRAAASVLESLDAPRQDGGGPQHGSNGPAYS